MDVGLQQSKYKKQVKYLLINISKIGNAEITLTTKRKFISAHVSLNRIILIDVGDIHSVRFLKVSVHHERLMLDFRFVRTGARDA